MEVLRPAGLNERRCIARDVLGAYGCIITLGTYHTSASGRPDSIKADVVRAVKQCTSEHPALSTVVQEADTEHPQFARTPQIHLDSHLIWERSPLREDSLEHGLGAWIERIHNQPMSASDVQPRWRLHLVLVTGAAGVRFHAAFAASHALTDGMSGLIFHQTFLRALRTLPSLSHDSKPVYVTTPQPSTPSAVPSLLPPTELAAPLPISWTFLLPQLAAHFLPTRLATLLGARTDLTDVWRGAARRPPPPAGGDLLPTNVHITHLSAETLARVLRACATRRVRLTGLVNVLAARAVAVVLRRRGRGGEAAWSRFRVDTALDLRRCIPAAHGRMGNYPSVLDEMIPVQVGSDGDVREVREEDWMLAKGITERLAAASATLRDQPVALLRYVDNYRAFTLGKMSEPADGSFSMSNLGVFRGGNDGGEGDWMVEGMLFSQSADGTGSPFNINLASSMGGPLTVVLSWWPGILGVEDERGFVKEVCEEICKFLESASA